MIRKNKALFFALSLIVLLTVSMGVISASDVDNSNTTVSSSVASSDNVVATSVSNDNSAYDNKDTSYATKKVKDTTVTSDNQKVKSINKKDVKTSTKRADNDGSFSDLNKSISESSEISLDKNYIRGTSENNITINKTVSIDGNGHTIDANKQIGAFIIGADASVEIKNTIFTNLQATTAGYVRNQSFFLVDGGNLTLTNVTFENNNGSSGASSIYLDNGTVKVYNSTFNKTNYGSYGAISNAYGTLIVDGSTFNNVSTQSGVIFNQYGNAKVNITNSVFTNNYCTLYGGAINTKGDLLVNNSYFENNTAETKGGAIAVRGKTSTIANSTFKSNKVTSQRSTGQGGAIYFSSTYIYVENNTMSGNYAYNGSDIFVSGSDSISRVNLTFMDAQSIEDETIKLSALVCDDNNNKITGATVTFNVANKTYTAPAVEGYANITITDSIESNNYTITGSYNGVITKGGILTVNEGNLEVVSSGLFKYSSLQSLIDENTNGTIILPSSVKRGSSEEKVIVNKTITIDGNGLFINANKGRIFEVTNSADLILKNMVLYNTYDINGSIININNTSKATLVNVTIINNTAYNYGSNKIGSLIYVNTDSNLTVANSTIENNTGAVMNILGSAVINDTTIKNITATNDYSSGIIDLTGNLTINNSIITKNVANLATVYGDKQRDGTYLIVDNSTFSYNKIPTGNGGAISHGSTAIITDSKFINNSVTKDFGRDGGAIYSKGDLTVNNTVFINNTATGDGSIIYNAYGKLNVTYSILIPSGTTSAVYNDIDTTPTLNYNWWGTNTNPKNYLASGKDYDNDYNEEYPLPTADYWVVMNTTLIPSASPDYASQLTVKTTLNTYTDADGNNQTLANNLQDGLIVTYSSNKGSFESQQTEIINGETQNTFLVPAGTSTITIKQANQENTFEINPVMPTPQTLIINETNFYDYFNTNGTIKLDKVNPNSQLEFSGTLTNKNMTITLPLNLTTHTTQGVFTNGVIYLTSDAEGTNITSLVINNNNYDQRAILLNKTTNINIENNTITTTSANKTHTIELINSTGILINNNTITTYGPSNNIQYDETYMGFADTSSIKVYNSKNNKITNNKITTNAISHNGSLDTINGIEILGNAMDFNNDIQSNNNTVYNNNIITNGVTYAYSVVVSSKVNNNTIKNNNVTSNGSYYANGIQLAGPATGNEISYNNINATAKNVTYGLYISTNDMGAVTNNNISYNNVNTNSSTSYAIELYGIKYNTISFNNITNDVLSTDYIIGIASSGSSNNNITNNDINIKGNEAKSPESGDTITADNTGIKLIKKSNSNLIQYNNITSLSQNTNNVAINLSESSQNIVTLNNLTATSKLGDQAATTDSTNTIKSNYPLLVITNDNYNNYFDENGNIKSLNSGSAIYLSGEFKNKNFIIDRTLDINTYTTQAILYNSTFIFTTGSTGSLLQNIIINNKNYAPQTIKVNDVNNITIKNVTINQENDQGNTTGILLETSDYNTIENNTINIIGLSYDIEYDAYGFGKCNTSAIQGYNSNYNNITGNTITVKAKGLGSTGSIIDTIMGIDFYGNSMDWDDFPTVYNNAITKNNITLDAIGYGYAIKVSDKANNANISDNIINSTAQGSAYGVEIDGPSSNSAISNNQINTTAQNFTYGIYFQSFMGSVSKVTVSNNTVNANSNVGYGIELYNVQTPTIKFNNITVTGNYSMGIGGIKVTDGVIANNTITTTGNSDNKLIASVDEIAPENTGIKLIAKLTSKSTDNNIQNNTITTNDLGSSDKVYTIILNGTKDNTIANNTLISTKLQGSNSVNQINSTDNIVRQNKPATPINITIEVSSISIEVKEAVNITAYFYDENKNTVQFGTATFYIDDVLYNTVDVANGMAKISYMNTTAGNHTLKVVYNQNEDYNTNETTAKIIVYSGETSYNGTVYVAPWGDNANNGTKDSPKQTISKAIAQALKENGSHDVVVLEGTYNVTDLVINSYLNITGEGNVIFNGQNRGMILNTTSGNIIVKNIVFVNATGSSNGGAIYNTANLTVINSTFKNNKATYGSSIYSKGNLTVINSTFDNNQATSQGAAIYGSYNSSRVFNITGSTFINNKATSHGGAIYESTGKNLTITDSVFKNNMGANGGSIYISSPAYIKNTTFTDNNSTGSGYSSYTAYGGGAIYSTSNGLTLENSTIMNNYAKSNGGAIISTYPMKIINSTITNNTAKSEGGAIYAKHNLTIINSTITNNNASNGGALYVYASSRILNITDSTIANNTARLGAIAYIEACKNFTITNTNFTNNGADTSKRLIYAYSNSITGSINDSKFIENTGNATVYGGKITINNTLFENNHSNGTLLEGSNIKTSDNTYIKNNITSIIAANSTIDSNNKATLNINVTTPETYNTTINTGIVTIKDNGNVIATENVVNGKATYEYVPTKGEHVITMEYADDTEDYANSNTTTTITITKLPSSTITTDVIKSDINNVTIKVTVTDENNQLVSNGTVNITTTDNTLLATGEIKDGIATLTVTSGVTLGENTLIISYSGNDFVENSTTTQTITTSKVSTTVNIEDISDVKLNQTATIKVTVQDIYGNLVNEGKVSITINDNLITTIDVENGIVTYQTTMNKVGNNTIRAVFVETDNYLSSINETSMKVLPLSVEAVLSDVTATVGKNTTLTARITDENGNAVNGGKVAFKVNGITIKDENGNTVYAQVVNGVAQITTSFNLNNKYYTLSVVYSGTSTYESARANATLTLLRKECSIVFDSPQTATLGEEITLKLTIDDNDNVINSGKVVFKLNGKTLRDTDGNVIYTKVTNNTAELKYTLPTKLSAKTYNITAVYGSSKTYNRTEITNKITLNKIVTTATKMPAKAISKATKTTSIIRV